MNNGVWRSWAKRLVAAGGRLRQDFEVKKQGVLRSAPSKQDDYVFEGSASGLFSNNLQAYNNLI